MIIGCQHAGIIVSNMEKALEFYRDVLGGEVLYGGGPDAGMDDMVNVPNAEGKTVHLRIGNCEIELVEYLRPKIKQELSAATIGTIHLCFEVDDIDYEMDRLKKKGVKFNAGPNMITEGEKKGFIWVYFNGPDGHQFELLEKRGFVYPRRKK